MEDSPGETPPPGWAARDGLIWGATQGTLQHLPTLRDGGVELLLAGLRLVAQVVVDLMLRRGRHLVSEVDVRGEVGEVAAQLGLVHQRSCARMQVELHVAVDRLIQRR